MNDTDRTELLAQEAAHLADRCDQLHRRVVALCGDTYDGPALYVGLAVAALRRTADHLGQAVRP